VLSPRKLATGAVVAGLAVPLLAGCGGSAGKANAPAPTAAVTPPRELTVPQMIATSRKSIVRISVETCGGSGEGTGFVVGPGLVATAAHVVDGASSIKLRMNSGSRSDALVVGFDRGRDLALLQASRPLRTQALGFETSTAPVGSDVVAMGFPLGLPLTATKGSITGLHRSITVEDVHYRDLLQTDAAVNPGNSGGPILDRRGRVVGMVVAGGEGVNGIGFGLPLGTVRPLIGAWSAAPTPVDVSQPCAPAVDPPPAAPPAPAPAPAPPPSLTTYYGSTFNLDYPDTWAIESQEQDKGSYIDTTVRDPQQSGRMIRVDLAPGNLADPMTSALALERGLSSEPGYRRIAMTPTTFEGFDAVWWEFVAYEHGVLVHKVDIQFMTGTDGWAILTQAPETEYSSWSSVFDQVRSSLAISDSATAQSADPSGSADAQAAAAESASGSANCNPNYTPCIPDVPYDLNCADIGEMVTVIGVDVYNLDGDGDGYACESYG